MQQLTVPLIKGQRKTATGYRDNLPVNMIAKIDSTEGDQGYLVAHEGLTEFASTSGTARGAYFSERLNAHLRVSGNYLESISSTGVVTTIGTIPGSGVCQFAESFNTVAILSDGDYWLYDGYSLTKVLDPDLGAPIDNAQFNNIYVMTDGQFLFHTDINNESSISSLKYSSSEFASDPIKGVMRTDSNKIVAFNRYSIEYFYFNANAPTGTSVLQRIDGQAIRVGIIGTNCKTMLDGRIFILGGRKEESPSIYILGSGGVQTVATREINRILSGYTEGQLSTVYLESRVVDGDKFLVVHLPDRTLLYNHSIAESVGINAAWSFVKTGEDSPWRARYGIYDPRASKWIYGDTQESKLAALDESVFSQYGIEQEALFYTPIMPLKLASINQMEIDTTPGFTADNFSSAFSMSYDSVTWGTEYTNLISTNYNTRYLCRRLGQVRDNVSFRFRFVSDERMTFSGMILHVG